MAVIIPCAGKSSRYPGRPKFLLTLPNGEMFIQKTIKKYLDMDTGDVHVVILKEHSEKYDARLAIENCIKHHINYNHLFIHELEEMTSGPAETVKFALNTIEKETPFFVTDCDSFFDLNNYMFENYVCVSDLRKNKHIKNVANKSFAQINEQSILTNIVEKSIISNYICVGGYGFASKDEYLKAYDSIEKIGEIYVSHVIKKLLEKEVFEIREVTNYLDLGTIEEFKEHRNKHSCYFVDIDGTLIENQSSYFANNYYTDYKPLENAISFLLKKKAEGATLIFTTARPNWAEKRTREVLDELGFEDCKLIMDLPHAPRYVVNDYNSSNPFPTAISVNVPRNNDSFWKDL